MYNTGDLIFFFASLPSPSLFPTDLKEGNLQISNSAFFTLILEMIGSCW